MEMIMNTWYYLKLYLLTVPVFFAIDLLWLGVIAKDLYQKNLAHLLSPDVNWPAAMVFYFMYIAGIILFAVKPAIDAQSMAKTPQSGGRSRAVIASSRLFCHRKFCVRKIFRVAVD